VSRSEDRAIVAEMRSPDKCLWDSGLREWRNPGFVALALPLEGTLRDSGSTMKHFAALLAGFAFSAATLYAQSSSSGVPESHRPPPGMCRIWIDGVPPAHQPAPTDCATAIRKRPLNARVVFGSEAPGKERNFTPAPPQRSNFSTPANTTPSHEEQDRAAQQQQQQREAQERQRAEAQARQREEQEKRAASHAPPSPPPRTQERAAPSPRPHSEKPQRPPRSSFSTRRPG
jgi:flagellar biosynthesis GTPase FlhF